ncbi:hypothetical protein CYMTET_8658 [Cymbomonas tetramitiformis]|uniref:Uncharacterized protein n=1 Tax=Cymbomonas tetramitiformis TaxID=36881 RepID=A0AAE0GUG8_9CHLO|nr:hypothetical protein CYMTET_8658 [Cymbomonas tetramitiformis]
MCASCCQVAVSVDGSFFVADGGCHDRIAHFNAQGWYIAQFYSSMRKAFVPHSVALDECAGRIYVADRPDMLVAVYTWAGRLITFLSLRDFGPMQDLALVPGELGGHLLVLTSPRRKGGSSAVIALRMNPKTNKLIVSAVVALPTISYPHRLAVLGGVSVPSLQLFIGDINHRAASHVHKVAASGGEESLDRIGPRELSYGLGPALHADSPGSPTSASTGRRTRMSLNDQRKYRHMKKHPHLAWLVSHGVYPNRSSLTKSAGVYHNGSRASKPSWILEN